jgi:hypothetical protein
VFVFLQELKDIPASAATKTFVHPFCGIDYEAGRFFIVKRTAAYVINAAFGQFHIFANSLDDIGCGEYFVYYFLWYHSKSFSFRAKVSGGEGDVERLAELAQFVSRAV